MTWPWFLVDPVIPAEVADVLRILSVLGSLTLLVAACYAMVVSHYRDQRVRFGLFAAFAVMLTAGSLVSFGRDAAWRLGVLPVLVALAVWSTVAYVRRELGERRHGR